MVGYLILVSWLVGCLVWFVGWLVCSLAGWLVGLLVWLVGWLFGRCWLVGFLVIGCLVGWLAGCLDGWMDGCLVGWLSGVNCN